MSEIVAHRGASYTAPENTLAAIRLAWTIGVDAVEVDVHLTSDRHIVVMHDESTVRTTGVHRLIREHTLEELRVLDAGRWKGERWVGERIPLLAEVLATIPDGKRLFIEVKCGQEIISELLRIFDASGRKSEQMAIISFDAQVITTLKRVRPALQAYWLCIPRVGNVAELVETALAANADGIDAHANPAIDNAWINAVRNAGLMIYVWTVDDPAMALRMARLGVDGITTNRPEEIRIRLIGNAWL
jgi:glycerophosphoryl diester phosphodiesterase